MRPPKLSGSFYRRTETTQPDKVILQAKTKPDKAAKARHGAGRTPPFQRFPDLVFCRGDTSRTTSETALKFEPRSSESETNK